MDTQKKKIKGELTFKILDLVVRGLLETRARTVALLKSGRSSRLLEKQLIKYLTKSDSDYCDFLEWRRFNLLVYKLKKEGLVEQSTKGLQITDKGRERHSTLLKRIFWKKQFKSEKDDKIKIVTFDVPEKEQGKRHWLRLMLRDLGFYMLQNSVWIAKVKLPKEFMHELKERQMLSYVHIFSISESGTLSNYSINLD